MRGVAPASRQDQPEAIPYLRDVLALAREEEEGWPGQLEELAASGVPLNLGEVEIEGGEEEVAETPEDENPGEGQPVDGGGDEEISLDSFDPTQIPEDADREWLAKRHQSLVADYTRKTQKAAEGSREAEQAQAIVDGLLDQEMAPHFLRLLGYDPTSQEFLDMFGLERVEPGEDGEELEELDPHQRIEILEQRLATRDEEEQRARQEDALEDFMAEEIETLESSIGRQFDEDEIAFLRFHAERKPGPRGLPDFESASQLLKGMFDRRQEEWLEKRKQSTPPPANGQPGAKRPDMTTQEGRLQAAREAAERAMASRD